MRPRTCSASRWGRLPFHRASSSSTGRLRPYAFHVGASFLGKPDLGHDERRLQPIITKPFPPQHPVVPFRDRMLSWKHEIPSTSAGHDFFYVQQVSKLINWSCGLGLNSCLCFQMKERSVRMPVARSSNLTDMFTQCVGDINRRC